MSNAYVGEVRMWSCSRIPVDWMECKCQALPRQQYEALHAVIGTRPERSGRLNMSLPGSP